jgi:hypothetical protein
MRCRERSFFHTVELRDECSDFLVEGEAINTEHDYIVKGKAWAKYDVYFTPESDCEPESRGADLIDYEVIIIDIVDAEDNTLLEEGGEVYDIAAEEFTEYMMEMLDDEAHEIANGGGL